MNRLAQPESLGRQFPTNGDSVSPISWRMTRSAMSSCSVGSLLMITSLAPLFLASIGNPAAGQTTSDDPIAMNRSQCCASSAARRIASSGIDCPNETVAVLTGSPQTVQTGAPPFIEAWLDPGDIVPLSTTDTPCVSGIAVELHDVVGCETRCLVQIVDILRDDGRKSFRPVE